MNDELMQMRTNRLIASYLEKMSLKSSKVSHIHSPRINEEDVYLLLDQIACLFFNSIDKNFDVFCTLKPKRKEKPFFLLQINPRGSFRKYTIFLKSPNPCDKPKPYSFFYHEIIHIANSFPSDFAEIKNLLFSYQFITEIHEKIILS